MAPDNEERSWAIKLFWSIYVLDRRWGFGTGMPFTLQDDDIDPSLPEPVSKDAPACYHAVANRLGRLFAIFESDDII